MMNRNPRYPSFIDELKHQHVDPLVNLKALRWPYVEGTLAGWLRVGHIFRWGCCRCVSYEYIVVNMRMNGFQTILSFSEALLSGAF